MDSKHGRDVDLELHKIKVNEIINRVSKRYYTPKKINWNKDITITRDVDIQFLFNRDDMGTENVMIFNYRLDEGHHLPLSALEVLFNTRLNILFDLNCYDDTPDGPESHCMWKYWSNDDYTIGLGIDGDDNVVNFVSELGSGTILVLREYEFKKLMKVYESYKEYAKTSMLRYLKSKNGRVKELNSTKRVHFTKTHFCIINETSDVRCKIPLVALAELIRNKGKILNDLLNEDCSHGNIYCTDENFQIKTKQLENFRVLCFEAKHENLWNSIQIRDSSFKKLIDFSENEEMEIDESHCNSIRINETKKIQFSSDFKTFTLIDEKKPATLTLPMSALAAIEKRRISINADLINETIVENCGKDFINEYWSNGVYAIRTGTFRNPHRHIDCKVLRFTRIKDNDYVICIQNQAVEKILEQYVFAELLH